MYYQGAPEPADMDFDRAETALLVIDVQNTYLETRERAALSVASADDDRRAFMGADPNEAARR